MEQSIKKIYIRGKVTGLSIAEYTFRFAFAQANLETKGFEVVNPVELVKERLSENDRNDWSKAIRVCIFELLTVDAYYSLDNARSSKGARLEKSILDALGVPEIMIDYDSPDFTIVLNNSNI